MRIQSAHLVAGTTLLAGFLLATPAFATDDKGDQARKDSASESHPGDLWETTSQMTMEGMPFAMPAHPMKVCARRDATQPPMGSDPHQKCENSNFKRSGSTVNWTANCKNPPMTGEGQITYDGTDSYGGTLKFTSEGHAMTIKLTGRKVGVCDKPLD
jgi:hypothetical protein